MKPFKNISYSCKEATLLSERAKEMKLSFLQRFKLSIHLSYCKYCQRFVQQSKLMDTAMKKYKEDLFESPSYNLSVEFKDSLQEKMKNK